jgi:phospholipase/carboxylesterase
VIDHADVLRGAGDPASERRGTLVLLHGYGSDEREVFDRVTRVLPERSIVSLRGPVREGEGFGWVSLRRSLRDLGTDELLGMADRVAGAVLDWLDGAALRPPVGLLGVSQGGVLALHLLRLAPERFSYAVTLSGYVLAGRRVGDDLLANRRPPVFWGRGDRDDLIPAADVARTADWLALHSTAVHRVYDIGHAQSDEQYDDVAAFVRSMPQ